MGTTNRENGVMEPGSTPAASGMKFRMKLLAADLSRDCGPARPIQAAHGSEIALAQHRADAERIACLEAIIAMLIEKNERIRQQLMDRM